MVAAPARIQRIQNFQNILESIRPRGSYPTRRPSHDEVVLLPIHILQRRSYRCNDVCERWRVICINDTGMPAWYVTMNALG
jgi:hypothetical protein